MSQTTKIMVYILNSRYPIYSYSDLTLGSIFLWEGGQTLSRLPGEGINALGNLSVF